MEKHAKEDMDFAKKYLFDEHIISLYKQMTLQLNSCTREKCKQCDLAYIVKDYVLPILQCLTNTITDYNMRLLTTKCLNTAVAFSMLLLGDIGVENAGWCDTQKVIERHTKGSDTNRKILDELKPDILNKTQVGRFVFYILMTDAYLPYNNTTKEDLFFCGHVLLIERINDGSGSEPIYYFYQSYINEYDFKGHMKRMNDTIEMSWERVKNILEKIDYLLTNGKWSQSVVDFWKDFTFVNTQKMVDSNNNNKIFLCYKKTPATECVGILKSYAEKCLANIPVGVDNEIYGDKSLYDSRQTPLTNGQMRISLTNLLRDIRINKKIINGGFRRSRK